MAASDDSSDTKELPLLIPGTIFHGRYEVVRCMKAGGMGAVYEVLHREIRKRQALKTMLPSLVSDPDMRSRFRLEASVAAEIESDHIVQVFDAGVDEQTGLPFLVMELLRGENLSTLLERRGRLPNDEVVTLIGQMGLALERTHAAGIVHRDLKPENLFLTLRDDGTPRLKLLDFGIAKVVAESTQPHTTRSFGTPLYMSPEQIRGDGDISSRADLYSLAQIAFTLLTGSAYWDAESRHSGGVYGLLLKVMAGPTEPASTRAQRLGVRLSADFDAWFRRATALQASNRYESASELVEELARALGIAPPRAARSAPAAPSVRPETDPFSTTLESRSSPPLIKTPIRTKSVDSTGALSSGDRFARRPSRRSRVLSMVFLALGIGFLALLARQASTPSAGGASSAPSASLADGERPQTRPSASLAHGERPQTRSSAFSQASGEPAQKPAQPEPARRPSPPAAGSASAGTRPDTTPRPAPSPAARRASPALRTVPPKPPAYDPTDIR